MKRVLPTNIGAILFNANPDGTPKDACPSCGRFADHVPVVIENKAEWPQMVERTVDLNGNIQGVRFIPKRQIVQYFSDTGEIVSYDPAYANPDLELGAITVEELKGEAVKNGVARQVETIEVPKIPADMDFESYSVDPATKTLKKKGPRP